MSQMIHQISPSPPPPITTNHSSNRISPTVLFIIILVSVIFFLCTILHLVVRCYLKKKRSSLSSSTTHSDHQSPQLSDSDTYRRQLRQLFRLHDSGLDQALIDSLPVFLYRDIIKGSSKEPFDCAVCLCEFSEDDKLRLLPVCSHAFHIECIDTWLLSNSTCPLCRGALCPPGHEDFSFEFFAAGDGGERVSPGEKPAESDIMSGKRVFSVRLGKFRSSNDNNVGEGGETSGNSCLDDRRCFSMGSSYQYIVAESDLVVTLCPNKEGLKSIAEGKRISMRSKGESFSVSKIWQWSNKRSKFANSQGETNLVGDASSYACSASGGRVVAGLSLSGRRFQGA